MATTRKTEVILADANGPAGGARSPDRPDGRRRTEGEGAGVPSR